MSSSSARPRRLGTARIVFLVIAAAAPLAAMVGNVPLALARGNGPGLPVAFLVAGAVLVCFAIGYGAMNARVVGSGVFYVYATRALGRTVGGATAYVSLIGYTALSIGLAASFGYFTQLVLGSLGIAIPWLIPTAIAVVVTAFLGYRNVDLSSKILGVLMSLEFAVLLVFSVFVIGDRGAAALPAVVFAPENVFTVALGVATMFAFVSFTGFESAALYGEEARDPARSVPRATLIAVVLTAVFYFFISWIIVGAIGPDQVSARAQSELGDLVVGLTLQYGGEALQSAVAVLLCTSLFASYLALHNAAARYLFLLGREGIMPARLGDYHARHQSPHVGSVTVSIVTILVLAVFALFGADPYTAIAASLIGLGTLAIILIQALTATSVVVFFRRRGDRAYGRTLVAPLIGAIGLTAGFVLATLNYSTLTGSNSPVIDAVPLVLLAIGACGAWSVRRLARVSPTRFAAFGASELRDRSAPERARIEYRRTYCLVGAGPAGMVMARALRDEGVPFDWFEKHDDFGGIWDMERPDTPMYESAHFISSKYTSGFYGQPMPAQLPDYPKWSQIRDYIRDFGRDWGLDEKVQFGVAVESARQRPGGGWSVTTSDGRTREYDGLIVAPGVTWHANRPALPGEESFRAEVRHAVTYRSSTEFAGKRVLVVGAGNSGVDIACDAARTADAAFLSVRRGYHFFPKHIGGLPTDAVLNGVIEPPKGVALAADPARVVDALVGDVTRLGLPSPDHAPLESHPIMNTQVLHYLAHGDIVAKSAIERLDGDDVVFVDGTREQVDLVLLATGYEYRIPFLDEDLLTWNQGHPVLTLRVFPEGIDDLAMLGMIEFADAAYKRFDEMAQLVMIDIYTREAGGALREQFLDVKTGPQPDLSGGHRYIDSPRHANYVDSNVYRRHLAGLRDRFGWPDPSDGSYAKPDRRGATSGGAA